MNWKQVKENWEENRKERSKEAFGVKNRGEKVWKKIWWNKMIDGAEEQLHDKTGSLGPCSRVRNDIGAQKYWKEYSSK